MSRDRILVATRDRRPADFKIGSSFVVYLRSPPAQFAATGRSNVAPTPPLANLTPKNFGCAVQHNVAVMIADPRDLQGPRPVEGGDANRAGTVITNYEQGKPTPAEKAQGQSGAVSDVGKQQ